MVSWTDVADRPMPSTQLYESLFLSSNIYTPINSLGSLTFYLLGHSDDLEHQAVFPERLIIGEEKQTETVPACFYTNP